MYHRHVVVAVDAAAVYADLFGASTAGFWLDGEFRPGGSRYSYMGDANGPNAERIGYDVVSGTVTVAKRGIPQTHRESIFD